MTRAESIEMFYKTFPSKDRCSETIFRKILDLFNLKASQAIAKGETLNLQIGKIKVVRTKRHSAFKIVDWGKSNAKKAEILKRGGVPYRKDISPEGEEWLIYYSEEDIFRSIFEPQPMAAKNTIIYAFKSYKDHSKRVSASSEHLEYTV